jgi:hypothetical protein
VNINAYTCNSFAYDKVIETERKNGIIGQAKG